MKRRSSTETRLGRFGADMRREGMGSLRNVAFVLPLAALLGGGGLLLRSLGALVAEGAGFDADGLVLLQASSPLSNDPRRWTATDLAKGKATMRALQLRLEQLPDVRVSFANAQRLVRHYLQAYERVAK